MEGDNAYNEEEWMIAIEKLEGAMLEYYKEERACRAECEGIYDNNGAEPLDFIHAVSGTVIENVIQGFFSVF